MADIEYYKKLAEDHTSIMTIFNRWIMNLHNGRSIVDYLHHLGYHKIVIYGFGYLGERLYEEIKNDSSVSIEYVIDQRGYNIYVTDKVKVYMIDDDLPEDVDLIVVTPMRYYVSICEKLKKKMSCDIISIEELVYSL